MNEIFLNFLNNLFNKLILNLELKNYFYVYVKYLNIEFQLIQSVIH